MGNCINLKERFGDRFKVELEETYTADHEKRNYADPWLHIIPGQFGHFYPHGGDMLGVAVNGKSTGIANRIRRMKCCQVTQDGDNGEVNAIFHVDHLDKVAEVIKPRKRRRLTPEQKEAAAVRLKSFQFEKATARQCGLSDQICDVGENTGLETTNTTEPILSVQG